MQDLFELTYTSYKRVNLIMCQGLTCDLCEDTVVLSEMDLLHALAAWWHGQTDPEQGN